MRSRLDPLNHSLTRLQVLRSQRAESGAFQKPWLAMAVKNLQKHFEMFQKCVLFLTVDIEEPAILQRLPDTSVAEFLQCNYLLKLGKVALHPASLHGMVLCFS